VFALPAAGTVLVIPLCVIAGHARFMLFCFMLFALRHRLWIISSKAFNYL